MAGKSPDRSRPSTGQLGEFCKRHEKAFRHIFAADNVLDRVEAYDSLTQPRGYNPGRRFSEIPALVLYKGVFSNSESCWELAKAYIQQKLLLAELDLERDVMDQQRQMDEELTIWASSLDSISLWESGVADSPWWDEVNSLRRPIYELQDERGFKLGPSYDVDDPDGECFSDDSLDIDPNEFK